LAIGVRDDIESRTQGSRCAPTLGFETESATTRNAMFFARSPKFPASSEWLERNRRRRKLGMVFRPNDSTAPTRPVGADRAQNKLLNLEGERTESPGLGSFARLVEKWIGYRAHRSGGCIGGFITDPIAVKRVMSLRWPDIPILICRSELTTFTLNRAGVFPCRYPSQ
jgi:hypothetical protein